MQPPPPPPGAAAVEAVAARKMQLGQSGRRPLGRGWRQPVFADSSVDALTDSVVDATTAFSPAEAAFVAHSPTDGGQGEGGDCKVTVVTTGWRQRLTTAKGAESQATTLSLGKNTKKNTKDKKAVPAAKGRGRPGRA